MMKDGEPESQSTSVTEENSAVKSVGDSPNNSTPLRGGQIGIKQMMAVTAVISVVCAVLTAVLRRLPEEQQIRGALFILLMVFICLAALVFFHVRRARIEKQGGLSHFITRAPLTSWFHFFGIASCIGTLVMMGVGLAFVAVGKDGVSVLSYWDFAYLFWMVGAFAGKYLVCAFLWKTSPNSVDVRENGLILGTFMFLPWGTFHGFRWNKFTKKLMLLREGRFIEWKVAENQRESLEQALANFIPKKKGFS